MTGDDDRINGDGNAPNSDDAACDSGEAQKTVEDNPASTAADEGTDASVSESDGKVSAPPPESPDVAKDAGEGGAPEAETENTPENPPPAVKDESGKPILGDPRTSSQRMLRTTSRLTKGERIAIWIAAAMLLVAVFTLLLMFRPVHDVWPFRLFGQPPIPEATPSPPPIAMDSATERVFKWMIEGQDSMADSVAQLLITQYPENSSVLYIGGVLKLRLGDANAAQSAIAKSLLIDPSPRKRVGLAAALLQQAIDTLGTDSAAAANLVNSADSLLEQAKASIERCPELYINKGIVEDLLGHEQAARAYYDTALQMDPTHPSLERYRKQKASEEKALARKESK